MQFGFISHELFKRKSNGPLDCFPDIFFQLPARAHLLTYKIWLDNKFGQHKSLAAKLLPWCFSRDLPLSYFLVIISTYDGTVSLRCLSTGLQIKVALSFIKSWIYSYFVLYFCLWFRSTYCFRSFPYSYLMPGQIDADFVFTLKLAPTPDMYLQLSCNVHQTQ